MLLAPYASQRPMRASGLLCKCTLCQAVKMGVEMKRMGGRLQYFFWDFDPASRDLHTTVPKTQHLSPVPLRFLMQSTFIVPFSTLRSRCIIRWAA